MADPRYRDHKSLTLRLKPSIGRLLEETAERMGISQTAVLTVALRELALKQGITESREEETAAA